MDAGWSEHALTGQAVVVAPSRSDRPKGATRDGCAFCPGHEDRTPPTLEQEPPAGPWASRAFANRFPILEHHEVIVDSPRHVARFDELSVEEATAAVRLWARRVAAAAARHPFVMLYRNDGSNGGASVPHGHAQLVGTRHALPYLAAEARRMERGCALDDAAAWAERDEREGLVVGRPRVARLAGERWLAPADHTPRFEDAPAPLRDAFARALWELARQAAARGSDYNVVLHTAPQGQARFHWHAEVLPRTDGIAGLELGAGVWVDPGRRT